MSSGGARNRNEALALALVEELARAGARRAVVSPGSRSTPVALALAGQPLIETAVILDERCAGFFALGSAIASGSPAIVACTSGSAAANLHPAIVEADQASVPLIVLTSDRPPELRGVGAGQTIDQLKLYGSAARWFCEVGTHEAGDEGLIHVRAVAARAVAEALGPTPGPVHLNLSWRDPLGPEPRPGDLTARSAAALYGGGGRPLTSVVRGRAALPGDLDRLAARLAGRERGLIVCGRSTDPSLREPLAALARATGYPLLAEPTSQLRSGPHDRGLVVAGYDLIARSEPQALTPEVVLRFGDMPTSKALRTWLAGLEDLDQIVVDPPGRWNEPTRTAATIVRADAGSLARGLSERLQGDGTGRDWPDAWMRAGRDALAAADEVLAAADPGINEPALHRALAGVFADGDSVLLASSMPIRDHETFSPGSAADVRVFANRGANGIDGTIATGSGIAAAAGSPTWIVLGDLALAHDLGGLATLTEAPGPIRLVVIDNGGGGIFDFLPQADQIDRKLYERLFTTPSGLDLGRVADLFGIAYAEIGSGDELGRIAEGGSVLAVARTDRAANVSLHREIADRAAEALRTVD